MRGEYIDLVDQAPFRDEAAPPVVFDLGTGTGVLAAVLAHRGAGQVIATDINPRAVACARENIHRLGLADRVQVREADLWPSGRADLIVCNPPWLPAQPTSALELGIYDPGSDVLHRFLDGLVDHLNPAGEGWLILSDLAEHLGLRTRITAADLLHEALRREVTSLWRLVRDEPPQLPEPVR